MKLLALLLTLAVAGPALAETSSVLVCRHTGAVMRHCCCAPSGPPAADDGIEAPCCCDVFTFAAASPGPWAAGKAIELASAGPAATAPSPRCPPPSVSFFSELCTDTGRELRSTKGLYLVVRRLLL